MHLLTTLLPLALPLLTHAALNGHCSGGNEPVINDGICVKTSTCASYGGISVTGACPNDPADVKCCYVNTCDHNHAKYYSYCSWTSHGCPRGAPGTGTYKSNLCPGGTDYKCCVFGP